MTGNVFSKALETFNEWFAMAQADSSIIEPTAMNLATCTVDGKPSNRIILLKAHDERGFVFYTNHEGRKSSELIENPHAALCFWWPSLHRQIRIEGSITTVTNEEADAYFASRRRGSQIGAWASQQSRPMESKAMLEARIAEVEKRFDGKDITRPPHWSGWRLVPHRIEFWYEGDYRIHDRWDYIKQTDGSWKHQLLFP